MPASKKDREYEFTVRLAGWGADETEAWEDACVAFQVDPGEPETVKLVEEEEVA
jgi:hypothetical protein